METPEAAEKQTFMLSQKGKRIAIALVVVVVLLLVRNVTQLQFSKFEGYWVGEDITLEIEKNGTIKGTSNRSWSWSSWTAPAKQSLVGKLESGKKVENTVKPVWQHVQVEVVNWEKSKHEYIQDRYELSSEEKIQFLDAKNLKQLQNATVNWAQKMADEQYSFILAGIDEGERAQFVKKFFDTIFSAMTLENDVLTFKLTEDKAKQINEMVGKAVGRSDVDIFSSMLDLKSDMDIYFYLVDDYTLLVVDETINREYYLNKSHTGNHP